ncbi:MAG: NAD-dependent deacylase [Spirochaetota bacterium]|nr:NAD-dependent deacylase [Spirochaetota bacterium]
MAIDSGLYKQAAEYILDSKRSCAFTGAGISVESGIPTFRGENGLWNKYDPGFLDISYFQSNAQKSWKLIKEVFYDYFGKAVPNSAHNALAWLEAGNYLQSIITQNIDNLHQEAGSANVIEYHGTSHELVCTGCNSRYVAEESLLKSLPPMCKNCGSVLKPDFVFFGEPIPDTANQKALREAEVADLFILIGTTGEIMPASMIPYQAKQNGAKIIEINITPSNYTNSITDIYLEGRATDVLGSLLDIIKRV